MAERPTKRKHVGSFTIGATIGQGAFGKVKLGVDVFTGEKVAVKIIGYKNVKTEKEKKQIEREQNILLQLKHPNIVNLKKVVNDEKRVRSYMIFEYAPRGELFDYIVSHGRLSERDARKFMRQIVSALEYCHSLLIIHRDLKPENLLLDEDYNIKISDFGLSNIMEPGKRFNTFCGSLHYACPEILRGEEYVGPGVDIWSIGIILYCLVVGRQPWDADNAEGLIYAILEDGLEVPSGLSDECVDLLLQMLRVSEYDRIPISKIRIHPWILKDYGVPPPSYLPPAEPITEIDEHILQDLYMLSFLESNEPSYLETIREELLSNKQTQLVVVYNLLLQQKKEKEVKLSPENEKKEPKKKTDTETQDKNTIPLSVSWPVPSTAPKKGKKSIIITGKGDMTPVKVPKIKNYATPHPKKTPMSPMDKLLAASSRQRSSSLSNENGKIHESDEGTQDNSEYSDEEDILNDTYSVLYPEELQEDPENSLALQNRQRAASVSVHVARPVVSFEDIISGKLSTPTKLPLKKNSLTPIKTKRPSVLNMDMFKPPEEEKEENHNPSKVNSLPQEPSTSMSLHLETVSNKKLEEIVEEIVRVLSKEEIKHRKRKKKYIWKCSADVGFETVQMELEIIQVKDDMCGIVARRVQGSFPHYQELYQRFKKELHI